MLNNNILIEKYRPNKLDEVIGQDEIIKRLKRYVKNKNIPHLLFSGNSGTGKTASTVAMVKELYGSEWKSNFMEINASDDRGIDVIRNKIKTYAGTKAIGDVNDIQFKIVFLDESDALCLDENTKIIIGKRSKKTIHKIKDIPQDGFIDMPSLNIFSHKIENDRGKCVDSGNIEMYKITLENGKEITASSEHPFFKLNEKKEIEEIKVKELTTDSKILDFQDDLNITRCEICKKYFIMSCYTKASRFCSMNCKNKAHSILMTGEGNSMYSKDAWNKNKKIVDDIRIAKQGHPGDTNCSKRQEVNQKKSESLKRFYESEEGKNLAVRLGNHLSEIKTGKSFRELFPNLTEEELEERRKQSSRIYNESGIFKDSNYRRHLKNLDEVECCECHKIIKVGGQDGIYVHHKDSNHKNNKRENLEFVCPKCHNLKKHNTMNTFLKIGWEILRGNNEKNNNQKSLSDY